MLEHWGIARSHVRLVRTRSLAVYPQAERLPDAGPVEAHLDLLDTLGEGIVGRREQDDGTVYVSRSASIAGGVAGEAYLESALERLNVGIFYPESVPLREQLRVYRRARKLIFCEGSAVHAL